ncbi:MAG: tetratricopeptide repeat protein [Bacteroidia bacterium]
MRILVSCTIYLSILSFWGCENPYESDKDNPDISYNVYFQENGREKLGKYLNVLKAFQATFEETYDENGELDGHLKLEINRPAFLANKPESRCKFVADKLAEVIVSGLHSSEDYDTLNIEIFGVKGSEDNIFVYQYPLAAMYSAVYGKEADFDSLSYDTHFRMAREAVAELDYTRALTHLQIILEDNFQNIPAMELRAEIYMQQKEYYSAVFQYAALIMLDSLNIHYLKESAKAHIEMEAFEDARKDIQAALNITKQKDSEAWFLQGKVNYMEDEMIAAEADFTAAILISPDYAQAYYYRGLTFKERSRRTEACEEFQLARDKGIYSEELDKELNRCRILDL